LRVRLRPSATPGIPGGAWIAPGRTAGGARAPGAHLNCLCRTWFAAEGSAQLLPGQSWCCPDCLRVYGFDGVRIEVADPLHPTDA
jgi:hypothetical protein